MLKKANRLNLEKDFQKIFHDGKLRRTEILDIRVRANNASCSRFGFIVSSKVDKRAVVRNRLRRQMSEIIKNNFKNIASGFDIVLVAKKEIIGKPFFEIEESLKNILKKAGPLSG
jgi:ribonuclease P protein component